MDFQDNGLQVPQTQVIIDKVRDYQLLKKDSETCC